MWFHSNWGAAMAGDVGDLAGLGGWPCAGGRAGGPFDHDVAAYEADMAAAPTVRPTAAEAEEMLAAAARYMAETGEGVW